MSRSWSILHLTKAAISLGLLVISLDAAEAAVVINKVRPWYGDTGLPESSPSQVYLFNTGPAAQPLSGWVLSGPSGDIALPAWTLPVRCYAVIEYAVGSDDPDFSDSIGTYHAALAPGLNRGADELGLYNGPPTSASLVDFVNWGEQTSSFGPAYAHALTAGQWTAGVFIDVWEHAAFSQIARIPSGYDNNTAGNWQELEMAYVTPMRQHNAMQIEPRDGILDSNVTELRWRAVPGASAYQVEVDNDSTFLSPEFSTVLFGQTSTPVTLPTGFYYWRVWPNVSSSSRAAIWRFFHGAPPIAVGMATVAVPQRFQHKDTQLLCIWNIANSTRGGCTEAAGAQGPWDAAHAQGAHIPICNHCRNYCTRASIQMVNAKYGGSLTQDEISYHGYQNNVVGPEGDLGHGVGMWPQEDLAYSWAMNNAAIAENFIGPPDAVIPWGTLTSEIDGGWPVLTVIRPPGWFHTVVFNGYAEFPVLFGAHRFIYITDPWPGRTGWYLWAAMPCVRFYILPAGALSGRATDPNVTADADGDGVMNFDEQHPDPASEQAARPFCSLFNDPDTEDDEVRDKQEIRSYTFHDIDHGHNNDALGFPDIDGDGLRQECDCDGDNDSDFDGGEDINGDGRNPIGGAETCEYQPDHLINCGVMLFPGPILCTEEVWLFGSTYHQFSWYPYEVTSPCIPPVDGQGIGWSGIVFSVALGIIPPQFIGLYGPGTYRVIVDVLRDHLYSEPDNWDPWTCWGIPPHCYLIIKTPDLTYTQSWYLPVLDSLNIQYTVALVPPGTDIPALPVIAPYFVVIMATGDTPPGLCISPNDAATLMGYLDQGGKLLISGDNIGSEVMQFPDPMRMQFYNNYLGAQFNSEFPLCQVGATQPGTFLQPPSTFQTRGPGGANYPQYSPDDVHAVNGSFAAARWANFCVTSAGVNVVARENLPTQSRSAYYSFPWENITSHNARVSMMDRTIDWLYGTPPPMPAVDDLTIRHVPSGVQLNWTPVPGAMGYQIHASTSTGFTPSPLTEIGYTTDPFFDVYVGDNNNPFAVMAVVAEGPAFGGGGGGDRLSTDTRTWLSEQTDIDVIRERLDREHVKYRWVQSKSPYAE